MATSTLALGQASYDLLESLEKVTQSINKDGSTTQTVRATQRGGEISGLRVEGSLEGGIYNFNIADRSVGMVIADNLDSFNSTNINFLANADQANVALGNGNQRFNASGAFTNSTLSSGEGYDTVRIGGAATGTDINLGNEDGWGSKFVTISRAQTDLDVNTGGGNDSLLFLGTLTAGGDPNNKPWSNSIDPSPQEYSNIINSGKGNDTVILIGGVKGNYEVQLSEGDDSVIFGARSASEYFSLDTGIGSDTVTLGYITNNARINLGTDGFYSDSLVLGLGAEITNSTITSGQDSGDFLTFNGNVTATDLNLGAGGDSIQANAFVSFGSGTSSTAWDLGAGNDTLIFNGDLSGGGIINLGSGQDSIALFGGGNGGQWYWNWNDSLLIDLGIDSEADTIEFGDPYAYSGFAIQNFGIEDILIIGGSSYGYNDLSYYSDDSVGDLAEFKQANNTWTLLGYPAP